MAITFVGSAVGSAIDGVNATINVGGIAGIANGDLIVVLSGGFNRTAGTGAVSTNGTGTFVESVNVLTGSQRARVNSKVRNGDTTITLTGSANAADALASVAMVFRGASANFDVTATTATGSSTNPNPPSISPVNNNVFIVAGAASLINDASPGTVTGFSTPVTSNSGAETNPQTVSACYLAANAGATNPAAFSSWSTGAWVAVSIALRPAMTTAFATGSPTLSTTPSFNTFIATALVANTLAVGSPVLAQAVGFQNNNGDDFYTRALMHFDGSENSTTFKDVSRGGTARDWNVSGAARLKTFTKKFGVTSGEFDGVVGSFIWTSPHSDFNYGSGDFTVDLWFRPTGAKDGTQRGLCAQIDASGVPYQSLIQLTAFNQLQMASTIGGVGYIIDCSTQFFSTDPNWHHAALVRSGNTLKAFVDGIQEGSTFIVSGAAHEFALDGFAIGRLGSITDHNYYYQGYIDEFRVSKFARWTSNFTPPTVAYGPALRAVDIFVQPPVIGSPALGQTGITTANSLTVGSPVLGNPVFKQIFILAPTGKTVASPTLSIAPVFDTATGPVATNIITSSPVLGTPLLKTKSFFSSTAFVVSSPIIGAPALIRHVTIAASAFATGSPKIGSKPTTLLGVYRGEVINGQFIVNQFETWLGGGVQLDMAQGHAAKDTWLNIEGPSWQLDPWSVWTHARSGRIFNYSVAMFPSSLGFGAGGLAMAANGDFDAHYTALGHSLKAYGLENSILRLGWEFSGGWMPWYAGGGQEANYAETFRRMVNCIRAAEPTLNCKFDWNANHDMDPAMFNLAYPGDAYVDYIGIDVYDACWVPNTYPYPVDCDAQCHLDRQTLAWASFQGPNIERFRQFAATHGKQLSFPEWGLIKSVAAQPGGLDNVYYMSKMLEFIYNPLNNVGYHSYFDVDNTSEDLNHQISTSSLDGLNTFVTAHPNGAQFYHDTIRNLSSSPVLSVNAATPINGAWNSSAHGSFTLSNGDKTCLSTLSATDACHSTDTNVNTSGKYVVRFTINGTLVPAQVQIANTGSGTSFIYWGSSGWTGSPGFNDSASITYAVGDVIDIAVDWDNGKYWIRKNSGNWNNDVIGNQNPAANIGGYLVNAINGLQQSVSIYANAPGEGATIDTNPAGMPAGFSGWYGNVAVSPSAGNLNLSSIGPTTTFPSQRVLTASPITIASPFLDEPDIGISLFAADLTTASPVLGTPVLTTRYTIVAINLATASPFLGSPTRVAASNFTSNIFVTGSPILGTPIYNRIYIFSQNQTILVPYIDSGVANDISSTNLTAAAFAGSSPVLGSPIITGNMRGASFATGSPVFGPAIFNQKRNLFSNSLIVSSPVIGTAIYARIYSFSQFPLGLLPDLGHPATQIYNNSLPAASNLTVGSPILVPPPLATRYGFVSTVLATASPVLGNPIFGQRQTLFVAGLAISSPVIGTGAIGAGHNLVSINLSIGSLGLGQPTIGQQQVLTATNLTISSPTLAAPSFVNNGTGVAVSLTVGSPVIGQAVLNQRQVLTAVAVETASPAIATSALMLTSSFVAVDLATGSPVISNGVLGAGYTLTTDLLVIGSPNLGQPILGQSHALTAVSLASSSPVIGAPTYTRNSSTNAVPISVGSPVIGTPIFNQKQILPVANVLVTTSPVIQIPNFTQKNILTAVGTTVSSPVINSTTISQGHSLIASNLNTNSLALGQPAINQLQILTASDLLVSSIAFGHPTITQNANGVAVPLVVGLPEIGSPNLNQKHILSATNLTVASSVISTAAFSQINLFATAGLTTGSPVLPVPAFNQRQTLIAGLTVQSPVIGTPQIAQNHKMIGFILLGQPVIGQPILVRDFIIKNLVASNLTTQRPILGNVAAGEVGTIVVSSRTLSLTAFSPHIKIKKVRHWRQVVSISGSNEVTGLRGNVGLNGNISGSVQ